MEIMSFIQKKESGEIVIEDGYSFKEEEWQFHFTFPEESVHANHFTDGLKQKYDHDDLQIILDIDPPIAYDIFSVVIEQIKNGKKFEPGKRYDDILEKYEVEFKEVNHLNRRFLRILLPDPNGKLPYEKECEEMYRSQLDEL